MDKSKIRDKWLKGYFDNKEYIDERVNEGIENNRKGYCKLRLTDKNGQPLVGKKIRVKQCTHDFKYGANIFMLDEFEKEDDNAEYRRFFKEYFNLATVPFYWYTLEPEEGKLRFDKNSSKIFRRPAPDLCLEYCEENKVAAKLHCLVYNGNGFIPAWLPQSDEQKMEQYYEKHIKEIAERYSGRMLEFEVINETLCQTLKNTPTVINQKRDLVEWSFSLARKYLPNETLVINEAQPFFTIESGYRHPYFMQIEKCLLNGAGIDKIGVQYHVFTGAHSGYDKNKYDAEIKNDSWKANPMISFQGLDIFKELGLPIEFTEVTIPTFGETEQDEDLQAEILKILYSVWFSHETVDTIVYWNTVDGYAFRKNTKSDENYIRGGLFHHDLTPKKSALMLKKLFGEIWHTDLELTTDKDGYVEFRGFYGDYSVSADDSRKEFGLHKNQNNYSVIEL